MAGPGRAIRAGHVEDLVTTFQDCASVPKLRVGASRKMIALVAPPVRVVSTWIEGCFFGDFFSWIAGEGFGMLLERSRQQV